MRYVWLVLFVLVGCGGGEFSAVATAGAAGAIGIGSGGAGSAGTANAGAPSAAGASTGGTAGTVANGGAASAVSGGGGSQDCVAPLPTTFSYIEYNLSSCLKCAASNPCWTATVTWDPSSLVFDEVNSKVAITAHVTSSGSISIIPDTHYSCGSTCSLQIPDFSIVTWFTVQKVSTGYQVTGVSAEDWTAQNILSEGSCIQPSSYLDGFRSAVQNAWQCTINAPCWLHGTYPLILPCVTPTK